MTEEEFTASLLTPEQLVQWQADLATLRDHQSEHAQSPLRMGDLINAMKQRWGEKMPALARAAGVSYHAARQRARVAERIPPGSPLRAMGLPYSILRVLAPVADPEPWAEKARALQVAGELRARRFARLLEEAGVHRSRPHRRLCHCLHCGAELEDDPQRIFLRRGDTCSDRVPPQAPLLRRGGCSTAGWLCSSPCAVAYFSAQESPLPAEAGSATQTPSTSVRTPHDPQESEGVGHPSTITHRPSPIGVAPPPPANRDSVSQRTSRPSRLPVCATRPRSACGRPRTAHPAPRTTRPRRPPPAARSRECPPRPSVAARNRSPPNREWR